MSSDLQRADERHRIRWLGVLTLVAVLGAAGILRLDNYLSGLHTLAVEAQPAAAAKARLIVRAVLALIATSGVLFSLYLSWLSWRTLSSERYPPPGARVFSDTRVRHGDAARRRGQAALVLAVLTLLLTLAVTARASKVFNRLLDVTLRPTRIEVADAYHSSASVGTSDGRLQISPDGG